MILIILLLFYFFGVFPIKHEQTFQLVEAVGLVGEWLGNRTPLQKFTRSIPSTLPTILSTLPTILSTLKRVAFT